MELSWICILENFLFSQPRGVEIVFKNFLLVQGQVNGHNVLVHRKFYLSKRTKITLYLSVLK